MGQIAREFIYLGIFSTRPLIYNSFFFRPLYVVHMKLFSNCVMQLYYKLHDIVKIQDVHKKVSCL